MTMKALSVQEPWAWLIAHGYKPLENRPWYFSHQGDLVIHAGKKNGPEQQRDYEQVRDRFPAIKMPLLRDMPFGGVVGIVKVIGCVSSDVHCTAEELPWFTGPYGIQLRAARICRFFECRGQLGIFALPDALVHPL